MIQYITFFFSSLLVTMMLKRKDVVLYLSTPPLLNGITVALIKALKGTPNVYNIQDLYPDIAVKLGVIKPGLLVDFCKFLEKYSYSQADGIVPIGMLMAQCVEEKGIPKSKITVIPNWTDTQKLRPLGKDTPFAREHNLTDKFIAMYSGNIGLSQGLENVIKAAQITADLPDLVYLFIGGGANLGALKKSADDLKLSNVRFLPYQPKNRLSESLSAADIHLLTLKKGLSNFSVPSKIYGIMASGRPLIASVDEDSEIKLMVGESQCGVCVPPEDPEAIAKAIRTLYHDRDKLNEMGENGRRYLENHITRTICVQAYEKLFEKIRDEYAA